MSTLGVLFGLSGGFFDPTGVLTFRTAQWFALFGASLVALLVWRKGLVARVNPVWLAGFLPFVISLALYPGAPPLTAAAGWAAFMVVLHLRAANERYYLVAVRSALVAACASVIFLALQAFGLDPLFRVPESVKGARILNIGTAQMTGLLGNAGDVGLFLALCLPLASIAFTSRWRWGLTAALGVGILLSGARLPLILGAGYLFFRLPGRRRWLIPAAVLLGVLLYPPLRTRTVHALDQGLISRQLETRFDEWRVAVAIIDERPIGHLAGFGGYGRESADFRFERGRSVPLRHGWFAQAHNDYLQTVVEAGWWGLLLMLTALLPVFRSVWRGETARAGLVMFSAAMVFLFPIRLAPAVLALALGTQIPGREPKAGSRLQSATLAVVLLSLGSGLTVVAGDWLAANGVMRVPRAAYAFFPEGAKQQALALARSEKAAGRPQAAVALYQQVLAHEPHPTAAMRLARLHFAADRPQEAIETLCRSSVATGHPGLRAWLTDLRPHLLRLAEADERMRACLAEPVQPQTDM